MSLPPEIEIRRWGLDRTPDGPIALHGQDLSELARRYGTPLHVVNRERLRHHARTFVDLARLYTEEKSRVHYACKCNGVPGILREMLAEGLNIEVMSPYELRTALAVGFPADRIIVNGPCKSELFLREAVHAGTQLIVIDSIDELRRLNQIAVERDIAPRILLRINPNIPVRGVNQGSSTGSRKRCAFGLDLWGGEVHFALDILRTSSLSFVGFHAHVGTGIRDPQVYRLLVEALSGVTRIAQRRGFPVSCLDLGGGFPTPTSREFSTTEMLAYQSFGRLPGAGNPPPPLEEYFNVISKALRNSSLLSDLSSVIFEPGRSIVSNAQFLLLSVEYIKRRKGTETWVITDGGLGTVALPAYYEYHEIIPCRPSRATHQESVTVIGPGCFAADILVRNKKLPRLAPGDVLAVMDSGAYFTAMESNFGYPRPGILAVDSQGEQLWRRQETFEDFIQRDNLNSYIHEVEL